MTVVSTRWSVVSLILSATLFALCQSTEAQQSKKMPRIGYLTAAHLSAIANQTQAFQEGLRELGYVNGKSILIEWRSAERQFDRLSQLAAELVRLDVDVIVKDDDPVERTVNRFPTPGPRTVTVPFESARAWRTALCPKVCSTGSGRRRPDFSEFGEWTAIRSISSCQLHPATR